MTAKIFEDTSTQQRAWAKLSAQLLIEEGFVDYRLAKNKAAKQLQISRGCAEPSIPMIEEEALSYYQLYRQTEDIRWHIDQLRFAQDSLTHLAAYKPKLAGTLIKHRPNALEEIEFHCRLPTAELVLDQLYQEGLPISIKDKCLRFSDGQKHNVPMYAIAVGGFYACLVILTESFHGLHVISTSTLKAQNYWETADIQMEISHLETILSTIPESEQTG